MAGNGNIPIAEPVHENPPVWDIPIHILRTKEEERTLTE